MKEGFQIKGLQLSKKYYEHYGFKMIRDEFPLYEKRIAVGLSGQGSECFGFDDEISKDHDFGPAFMMWLTDEDYNQIGAKLEKSYNELPEEFMGYKRKSTREGGVQKIGSFYKKYIGKSGEPLTLKEWLYLPEHFLATATNGKIFRDDLGEMTKTRKYLLSYYPEDIRIKKIAARVAIMAQSGQYNYSRSMRRKEVVAARLAIDEFIKSAISLTYLLNKQYCPFYKWMHRGMKNFSILPEMDKLIEDIIYIPIELDAWKDEEDLYYKYNINTKDSLVFTIEKICRLIIEELKRQSLTDKDDDFLQNHTHSIISKIKNEKIRSIHVMVG